ncbi:MAG: gluconate 2-dehydrogenase subunit 3 family protein [Woeseiales bacterium]|jgi:hypothetical protein|nr:gluconate 2-dehydrogenase subunit 3 family protein [Alphaproteobacteria bacterium]
MPSDSDRPQLITRREAILRVSAMFGGVALVGQSAMLVSCASQPVGERAQSTSNSLFKQGDITLLDEIAETILPETSTPGAKAAGVGPFIAMMVIDTYYENDQQIVRDGLNSLQAQSLRLYGAHFQIVTAAQRLTLAERLDAEQHLYMETREEGAPVHFFRMLKELTLLGYFTSEIGYTQAMRYTETPGRFDPCVPYSRGDKSWADHA